MRFQFYPLRFELVARESLYFPPGKAGNLLRGAFGIIFKRMSCAAGESCAYRRVFEPVATGAGPSGLADSPRPFVFRARHLDGHTIQPGQSFYFDLHLFSLDPDILACFVRTFAALAHEGLGPRRGKAELQRVRRLALGDIPEKLLLEGETQAAGAVEPAFLDLEPQTTATPSPAAHKVRVDFLSPTELKHERRISNRPEFPILFGRIRDRISTLSQLYGPGPLDIDFQAIGARASSVRMTNCQVRRQELERFSTRTGQTHSIGGFTGFAEYEGDMAEFLPYLEAGRWVGVGRQLVWGKGEISIVLPTILSRS
jgi:hypothetical protein